jgi:hypothetical protein
VKVRLPACIGLHSLLRPISLLPSSLQQHQSSSSASHPTLDMH